MARRRRRRGEFFLSEPIIRRIQSFLNGREAAQTTVLSKSWRQAWLTRPNLDFDFSQLSIVVEVSELMDKTIRRYEESNLKIESLSLIMGSSNCLCEDLIIKALRMGVTRLSLQLSNENGCDQVLAEVLGSEHLVELSLQGCRIAPSPEHKIGCSRLKSLSLSEFKLESDEVIFGLLSGCPLLENLSLTGFVHGTVSLPNLPNLPKLKRLELRYLRINSSFLGDLSCKFPLLRSFAFRCFYLESDLVISSPSIEHLDIETERILGPVRLEFDVPSIRKFEFKSWENLPPSSLSFKSTSLREWESHLYIKSHCCVGTVGVIGLNKLLTSLGQSKIHLWIEVYKYNSERSFNYDVWEFNGLTLHQVEELTIDGMDCKVPSLTNFALFDGLFRLCRPKLITQQNQASYQSDFLFKTFLRHGTNHVCSARSLCMYGLRQLEEVRGQIFYEDVDTWRLIPLDAWDAFKEHKKIRFQLRWREEESQQVN
ncbi:Putative F-box/LRR-repeat protein [Striga hermonthica]|uniref:F-box/LRR-repeat protein n=1 Tax=Striga hermonthica TaxID=68872 RepID=A0A9N7N422_STRHE|nr:Putative F-box/LRR-repeat protein [Striga hermonthica]